MRSNKTGSPYETSGTRQGGADPLKRGRNSAYNALRHGLASETRKHITYQPEVTILAKIMCNGEDNPLLFEKALAVAECDLSIRDIRKYKNRLLVRLQDPNTLATNEIRKERRLRFKQHDRKSKNGTNLIAAFVGLDAPPDAAAHFEQCMKEYWSVDADRSPDDAWAKALPDLARISRYERRAWSRRRRAFMEYVAVLSGFGATTFT